MSPWEAWLFAAGFFFSLVPPQHPQNGILAMCCPVVTEFVVLEKVVTRVAGLCATRHNSRIHPMAASRGAHRQHGSPQAQRVSTIKARIAQIRIRTAEVEAEIVGGQPNEPDCKKH